jgi:outer membrane immunogenic protein
MKKLILFTLVAISASNAMAKSSSLTKGLDSLGSNKAIAERAKSIDAQNKIRVVQNRTVDRDLRLEVGFSYDGVTGGDSYIMTNNVGYMLDFHINPNISIGARYYDAYNSLSSEGERVYSDARARQAAGDITARPPDVDYPLSSTLGMVTLYPLYGKLNFFNMGVTQFDVYVMGGYGDIKLQSGSTATWTAGGGIGIWWSQHLTSRIEARYQAFEDQIYTGAREQAITAFSIGFGFML